MTNYEIADHFSLLGKLMDIHGENSFKSKSYSVAAFNIEKMDVQLIDFPKETIFTLPGIGEAIGKKIIELLDTSEIRLLIELLEKTPAGVLEIMKIKGLGPKKVNIIWKEMGIESVGELLYACHENRLLLFKGFGEKTQNNVKESIEFYQKHQGSYLYAQLELLAEKLKNFLQKLFDSKEIAITGAFRRQAETITHLDYIIPIPAEDIIIRTAELEQFELLEVAGNIVIYKYDGGIRIRLISCKQNESVLSLFNTTGSDEFIEAFAKEYSTIDLTGISDEHSLFNKVGLQFIPACLREDSQILKLATRQEIPELIQHGDIRGLIHSHSKWSDGSYTLEEMADGCMKQNLEYLVISDHSKTAFYANGLSEDRVKAQHVMIDELNNKYITSSGMGQAFKIFKSIESDILNDGSLDYSLEVLKSFDLVIASVHSNLKMSEEKAMKRLIAAIENPFTIILGHMTGRLLLSRNGFPVDHKKIIDACVANHVAIELNAHPRRLDMRWEWLGYAIEKNAMICINPDAHSIEEYDNTRYGVLSAQKGMLTKECNLSSFGLIAFQDYLKIVKIKKGIA